MRAIAGMAPSYNKLVRYNTHKLAILRALPLKPDLASFLRKQRVITAYADISACMNARSTLPNENVAGYNCLAAEHLDAQSFGF